MIQSYALAPMEGVTGYVFRNAFHRHFSGADRYITPFLSPGEGRAFGKRERKEILPEHNEGMNVIPQLLTKRADDFLHAAVELKAMGYREVNLNLGCPSGTVVAKGKGSGFLAHPAELELFLDRIFSASVLPISVKTRLGKHESDEFDALLELFNHYPMTELTIHPRIQKDFYRHGVRIDEFARHLPHCRMAVTYNGDLYTRADCAAFSSRFPTVESVMIGRGLVANPALLSQLRGGPAASKEQLYAFVDALYRGYQDAFQNRRNAMMRMKELWFYLIHLFEGGEGYLKKIRKTDNPLEYEAQVAGIFRNLLLLEDTVAAW